jgi:protein-L-isoaspartate(D-aspartate) O-methyltransferase
MIKLEVLLAITLAIALLLSVAAAAIARDDEWQSMRKEMIEEIKQDMAAARSYTGKEALSDPVLTALARVERHEFIPVELRDQAYGNYPLPIGNDQTISQPFIVALMTELLEVRQDSIILEIGTGSGYQAAVLAEIVKEVYTVEIIADLANQAKALLAKLGYKNIQVRHGDGMLGWAGKSFDGIIVTAAGLDIPDTLLDQLVPGGHLVMPIGGQDETQQLKVITKNSDETYSERNVLPVRFVPITKQKR